MGLFDIVGDIVSLPLDVVSDASKAVQGKKPESTKERIDELGDDIVETLEDVFNI